MGRVTPFQRNYDKVYRNQEAAMREMYRTAKEESRANSLQAEPRVIPPTVSQLELQAGQAFELYSLDVEADGRITDVNFIADNVQGNAKLRVFVNGNFVHEIPYVSGRMKLPSNNMPVKENDEISVLIEAGDAVVTASCSGVTYRFWAA
jgi:hypothetical protein